MRPLKHLAVLTVLLFICTAANADAAPRPVPARNLLAGPVIGGAELVYVDRPRGKTAVLRSARPSRRPRTIRRFSGATSASVGASEEAYAVVVRKGRSGGTVWGGLSGRRPALLARYCSPSARGTFGGDRPEVAVWGTRVAFVSETCRAGKATERRVIVHDLLDPSTRQDVAATSYTTLAFAKDFVAYHDVTDPAVIFVHDLRTRSTIYGISQEDVDGLDIQDDGTLVIGHLFPSSDDFIVWHSWGDQRGHGTEHCFEGEEIAIDSNRIACTGLDRAGRFDALIVKDLRDRVRTRIPVRREISGDVDIRGPRVAYATAGCSKGRKNLWLVDHAKKKSLPTPAASACRR